MKHRFLILLIVFILCTFSFSSESVAAEMHSANIYLMKDVWNGNTGVQTEYGIQSSWLVTSNSPIYLYYYGPEHIPSSSRGDITIFAISQSELVTSDQITSETTFLDSEGNTWYTVFFSLGINMAYPYYGNYSFVVTDAESSFKLTSACYNINDFVTNYTNGTLDCNKDIDFNNEVYNQNIGYLQNVGLKITGTGGNDFTLLWAVENSDYLTDDWRVQVGWMTNFQEGLFGEKKAYTNLKLVSWDDELLYKTGRVEFKMSELWGMIPDATSFSHNGYFLARIIHVNNETGVFETGGWTQIHYIYDIEELEINLTLIVSCPSISYM